MEWSVLVRVGHPFLIPQTRPHRMRTKPRAHTAIINSCVILVSHSNIKNIDKALLSQLAPPALKANITLRQQKPKIHHFQHPIWNPYQDFTKNPNNAVINHCTEHDDSYMPTIQATHSMTLNGNQAISGPFKPLASNDAYNYKACLTELNKDAKSCNSTGRCLSTWHNPCHANLSQPITTPMTLPCPDH